MIYLLLIPLFFICLHLSYVCVALVYPKLTSKKSAAPMEEPSGKTYTIEHIVCFKNETAFVQKKLENAYSLDTRHEIHHTFINDNSSDDTPALLETLAKNRTTLIHNTTNIGKNQSQIKAVNQSESDFLLFTDANVFITDDTVESLIAAFDEDTGGVTGNVRVTTDLKNQDFSGRYWELEKKLKAFQSLFGTVIGFDGGLYCVKRDYYCLTRENELSDLETAFLIFEQQKKTKYITHATALELEKRTLKNSIRSRIRACNRSFWSFHRIFKYLKQLKPMVIFHFVCHKILRYLSAITFILFLPLIVLVLFKTSIYLPLLFLVPAVTRITLESIALCIGGIIALTGTEYKTWSQKKL